MVYYTDPRFTISYLLNPPIGTVMQSVDAVQESLVSTEEPTMSTALSRMDEMHTEIAAINKKLKEDLQEIVSLPKSKVCKIARAFEGVNKRNVTRLVPQKRREIAENLKRLVLLGKAGREPVAGSKTFFNRSHFTQHGVHLIAVASRVNGQGDLVDQEVMELFHKIDKISKAVLEQERCCKKRCTKDTYAELAGELNLLRERITPRFE